jgi:hypothetical protein
MLEMERKGDKERKKQININLPLCLNINVSRNISICRMYHLKCIEIVAAVCEAFSNA